MMFHSDHHTNQCKLEAQRIIHLQNFSNQLPDVFIDKENDKVTYLG